MPDAFWRVSIKAGKPKRWRFASDRKLLEIALHGTIGDKWDLSSRQRLPLTVMRAMAAPTMPTPA
jgi:hypothetical protein